MAPLLRVGLGPRDMYLLRVPGRRSGRLIEVPVNVMAFRGQDYIVAPRGEVAWVKNLRAAGHGEIRRGWRRTAVAAEELGVAQRAPVLREYLRRYRAATARYFPIDAEADEAAFAELAGDYPVFVLQKWGHASFPGPKTNE